MSMLASLVQGFKPRLRIKSRPNPRDRWPVWTDADCWTITDDGFLDIEPDPPAFEPSEIEQASACGYDRGFAHDSHAVPPAEWSDRVKLAWWYSRNKGWLDREHQDRLIDQFADAAYEPGNCLTDLDVHPYGVC